MISQLPPEYFTDGIVPNFDWTGFVCVLIMLIFCVWQWRSAKRNQKKPQTHKVIKALMKEGGALDNLAQFEEEIAAKDALEFPNLILGEHWIFYNGYYRLRLRNTSEIACVFDKKTQDASFLTRWATRKRDVVVGFTDKKSWTVKFNKNLEDLDDFKRIISEMFPTVIIEDDDISSKEIARKWENKPEEILELMAIKRMKLRKKDRDAKKDKEKEPTPV
jgi:hypothetical protein